LIGNSDYHRWKKKSSFFLNWDERTEILASFIDKDSKVFEFGAGRLALKKMLPKNCEYFHSDLVKRANDTLVIDLNKTLPQIPEVDFIVFSGVLEYINNVDKLLVHLGNKTRCFLFSYARKDEFNSINFRRSQGWLSDLQHEDFENIAMKLNADIEVVARWNNQTLYKMTKCLQ
jgi:hypothetical protein